MFRREEPNKNTIVGIQVDPVDVDVENKMEQAILLNCLVSCCSAGALQVYTTLTNSSKKLETE